MKNIYYFLVFLLLLTPVSPSIANPSRNGDDGEPIPIQINDPREEDEHNHFRGPLIVPVEAYLVSSTQSVTVNFLYAIGDVTISLTNLSIGVHTSTIIDSSIGNAIIPVILGTGVYRIVFSTENGAEYQGSFIY